MEKSIESIWKEGFIEPAALIAPKINDIYNQKSQNVVDRFKRLGKRNLYGIGIGSVLLFVGCIAIGVPLIGAFIMLILWYLIRVGIRQYKDLQKIDKGESSYQYLKDFDTWLKASVAEYGRVYRFVYPLLFLGIILAMLYSSLYESAFGGMPIDLIMNHPGTTMVMGLPVLWVSGIAILLGLIAYFSGAIYKFDLNTVYSGIFRKLEEILTDMEELRK